MEPTANIPTNRKRIARIAFQSVGAAVLPFLADSLYLVLTRWPHRGFTALSDYCGLGVALLIGATMVGTLPISFAVRIALLCFYIPLISFLLFMYSLEFVGVVFGDWL